MKNGALALAGHKRGQKDSTATPTWLYKELDDEFHFDCDPCPLNATPLFDGLSIEWGRCNYVNPPYSNKTPWIRKALIEMSKGKTSVMLLPVDTSTNWFHNLIKPNAKEIRFLRKRLVFPPNTTHAAYASMIVIFKP